MLNDAGMPPLDIGPDDPILAYFASARGPAEVDALNFDSPAVAALKASGIKLVVPLVNQGELVGLLNLGPRMSEQDYSTDDRTLLERLATQAAPAVRVALLVRAQEAEARARERIAQELEVARLIQQNFLPKHVPELIGWQLAARYQPAREVGGDFYDFIELPEGCLGIVLGDVSGKGVPAALLMSATRAVLRASAQRLMAPGEVLRRANEVLCPDMPRNMFVTCFYAVLDPVSARLRYANAGQSLPYLRTETGVVELRACGMPLGLLPDMGYDEKEVEVVPGASVLFHSDGLAEAHDVEGQMFGMPRLRALVASGSGGAELISQLLAELGRFARAGEQEDDVTLVTLERAPDGADYDGSHERVG
ncbi:MAG: Serine phosphatase RsbU (Regulator of sigma subunit) [Chloroflexi bacterium]|nr:Serine phosphatase RsbU (Regulator of sigma subunit) [Chloroflexota bacterium]